MYRKIIFIVINLLNINSLTKVTLLLFISTLVFLITYFTRPFVFAPLNQIELYSLMSAIITLFAGALYISDVNDYLKAISFMVILLVNFAFVLTWLFSLLNIVFETNFNKMKEKCPALAYKLMAFLKTLQKTKRSWNFFKYVKRMRKTYHTEKEEIIKEIEVEKSLNKKKPPIKKLSPEIFKFPMPSPEKWVKTQLNIEILLIFNFPFKNQIKFWN